MNEILILSSVIVIFSFVLISFRMFGLTGLFITTVIATICANIEVMILVKAFGIEQTLGNVLFASTFLCTDIASEIYGRKIANKIVNSGIVASLFFIVVSQSWLFYTPSPNDFAFPHIKGVFTNTPRIMIAGFLVYAISQKFDVFMYEFIWKQSDKKFGDHKKYLWLRNNGSTFLSQLLNSVLFTFAAFYGEYPNDVLVSILYMTYLVFIVLAFLDTAFVYAARKMYNDGKIKEIAKI